MFIDVADGVEWIQYVPAERVSYRIIHYWADKDWIVDWGLEHIKPMDSFQEIPLNWTFR